MAAGAAHGLNLCGPCRAILHSH